MSGFSVQVSGKKSTRPETSLTNGFDLHPLVLIDSKPVQPVLFLASSPYPNWKWMTTENDFVYNSKCGYLQRTSGLCNRCWRWSDSRMCDCLSTLGCVTSNRMKAFQNTTSLLFCTILFGFEALFDVTHPYVRVSYVRESGYLQRRWDLTGAL